MVSCFILPIVKKCPADYITSLSNGKLLTSQTAFFYGDIISYICNIGTLVSGSAKNVGMVTCNSTGQWTSRPACEGKCAVLVKGNIHSKQHITELTKSFNWSFQYQFHQVCVLRNCEQCCL